MLTSKQRSYLIGLSNQLEPVVHIGKNGVSPESVRQVVSRQELLDIRSAADDVYIKDEMIEYIVTLCEKTRGDPRIVQGASPRASLALTALSKATAWIQGRDYVLPRDVRFVFHDCIEHRLIWPQEITSAGEKDEVKACCLNVKHSCDIIEHSLQIQKDEEEYGLKVLGAIYHLESGEVEFL